MKETTVGLPLRAALPRWTKLFMLALLALLAVGVVPRDTEAAFPGANDSIAWCYRAASGAGDGIYLMDADGANQRLAIPGTYHSLSASANGRRLAYAGFAGPLVISDLDGKHASIVRNDGRQPGFSPDGDTLVFAAGPFTDNLNPTLYIHEDDGKVSSLGVSGHHPQFSPDGKTIVFERSVRDDSISTSNPSNVFVMKADGTDVEQLTNFAAAPFSFRQRTSAAPSFTPNGQRILLIHSGPDQGDDELTTHDLWTIKPDGSDPQLVVTVTNSCFASFSPDGTQIVIAPEESDDGLVTEIFTYDVQGGTAAQLTRTPEPNSGINVNDSPVWLLPASGLQVDLEAFDADGQAIDGDLSADQTLSVRLTITNNGKTTLKKFRFENDLPLVIDSRSPGGARVVEGPIPNRNWKKLKLKKGKSTTLDFKVMTTAPGLVAAHCKVYAQDKKGNEVDAARSLRLDIESGEVVTEEVTKFIMVQVIRSVLVEKFEQYYAGLETRGVKLRDQLLKYLSPANRDAWFSNPDGFSIDNLDWARALLTGSSPQMVDARLPDGPFQGHTVESLNTAYNESFKKELGEGMRKYVKRWKHTAGSVQNGMKDSYSEALLASYYFFGNSTPQEQTEFVSKMVDIADTNDATANSIVNTIKREAPRWQENGTYLNEAIKVAVLDATLQSPDLQAQLAQEKRWRKNMLKLADKDPVRFQREWAKRDAEIANLALPVVFDTIFGGIASRGFSTASNVVIKGRGASVIQAGKAAGVLDEAGVAVAGPKTGVTIVESGAPQGARVSNASRTSKEFLESIDDATLVRSSDAGNIYELPNVGGVPEITLEAKSGILKQLEDKLFQKTGKNIRLVEALKPSSPLRKPGGVAKLELTEQKTGKPSMMDAGMPPDALGEANVWRNSAHPSTRPGFNAMSKPRKVAAIDEWTTANKRWAEWENPAPGSKTERLKQMIGQEARVPLDLTPNSAGIQRFIVGEFEEVVIQQGTAEARLIRVKKYKIEVVDTNSGRVVNSKTVVNSNKALAQTPDADAVAVLKEVGKDAQGKPILKRLTPAEERIVMPEYTDLNIKARRSGLIPDAAEHGATLLLNDASAQAAGKILPRYGVPFLGEKAGTAFLKRIAPFVKSGGLTNEQMVTKMLKLVNEEGGFGQHLVLVTRDSRYLGELNVAAW